MATSAQATAMSAQSSASTFTLGGTVSGAAGPLVLQLNGGVDTFDIPVGGGAFAFSRRLLPGDSYVVTYSPPSLNSFASLAITSQTCIFTNGSGTIATSDVTSVRLDCFTPDDSGVAAIDASSSSGTTQLLALDSGGNAMAIWRQGPGNGRIWAARSSAVGGWASTGPIDSASTNGSYNPALATDGSGNAVSAWVQVDGTLAVVWGSRYIAGQGWVVPTMLSKSFVLPNIGTYGLSGLTPIIYPSVSLSLDGIGMAVWEEYDTTATNLHVMALSLIHI